MLDNPGRIAVSDEQLVAAVLQGDISTFGAIVERYWKMATGLALSRIHNAAEAEDIAQESFLTAYSNLHRLRDPSRFAGWLNGRLVHEHWEEHGRGAMPDNDRVPVTFMKGRNQLVLKIQNAGGPWGFACRLMETAEEHKAGDRQ
jgi:hypothetical protein